jgi:5'-nucleotidase
LEQIEIPVLAANLIVDKEPALKDKPILTPSHIFNMEDGIKIGVIGYLTPETKGLAIPNEVEFVDEIVAIK